MNSILVIAVMTFAHEAMTGRPPMCATNATKMFALLIRSVSKQLYAMIASNASKKWIFPYSSLTPCTAVQQMLTDFRSFCM